MPPTPADVRARPRRDVDLEPLQLADAPLTSLVALKASGGGAPMFFVHQGYGHIFQYKRIAERLRDDIPLYAFEARGFRDGLEPRTDIDEMAAAYLEDLRLIRPSGPYLLAGFSFGGYVAWQMARRLVNEGEDVRLLMIDIGPALDTKNNMNRVRKLGRVIAYHWKVWRGLEGDARKAYRVSAFRDQVWALAAALRLDPNGFLYGLAHRVGKRRSQTSGFLPVFRANMVAMDGWEFPPYSRPFTLFRAELQPPNYPEEPTLGFGPEQVLGGIDVQPVPGTHTFLFHEPHINAFVAQLEAWHDRQSASMASDVAASADVSPTLRSAASAPAEA